jgi:pimeloyl-ACP methyl ester carboxylesterase
MGLPFRRGPWAKVGLAALGLAAAICLCSCVSEISSPSPALRNVGASRYCQIGGQTVHYYDWGAETAGEVMLYVHGWAGSGIEALPLAEELASRRTNVRVIAVDLPGSGFSHRPDSSLGMDGHVDFLDGWIGYVGSRLAPAGVSLTLWGHSLGGHMVLRGLYDRRFGPAAPVDSAFAGVDRVVLCAPAGLRGEEGVLLAFRNRELMLALNPLFTHEMYYRSSKEKTFYDIGNAPPLVRELGWSGLVYRGGMRVLADVTEDTLGSAPLDGQLGSIRLPILLVWGRQDRVLDFRYSAVFARELPDVRFAALDRCGHPPHIDRSTAVADLVVDFLDGDT